MASHTDPTSFAADVLADPSEHTVDEVLTAFESASIADVTNAQALEMAGKNRKAIAEYDPPLPAAKPNEPTFSRDRVLGTDGIKITGQPRHVIAGALHGISQDEFTRSQLQALVQNFLDRPVHTAQRA